MTSTSSDLVRNAAEGSGGAAALGSIAKCSSPPPSEGDEGPKIPSAFAGSDLVKTLGCQGPDKAVRVEIAPNSRLPL